MVAGWLAGQNGFSSSALASSGSRIPQLDAGQIYWGRMRIYASSAPNPLYTWPLANVSLLSSGRESKKKQAPVRFVDSRISAIDVSNVIIFALFLAIVIEIGRFIVTRVTTTKIKLFVALIPKGSIVIG